MQRKASAVWKGGLKEGKGTVSATSGVLSNTPYSFTTRLKTSRHESGRIDSAAMQRVFPWRCRRSWRREPHPESINTSATSPWKNWMRLTITAVHLDVVGRVPKATMLLPEAAEDAKKAARFKVLNAKITMDAKWKVSGGLRASTICATLAL